MASKAQVAPFGTPFGRSPQGHAPERLLELPGRNGRLHVSEALLLPGWPQSSWSADRKGPPQMGTRGAVFQLERTARTEQASASKKLAARSVTARKEQASA